MIQLNLLPDLKKEFVKAQKTKALVISSSILVTLAAIGLSVLLFVYVTFLQQVQINLATDDINKKSQEVKAIPDIDNYLTIQNQLKALPELHNGKGSYARLFDFLAVLNPGAPNNISLSNVQISSTEGTVVFTGTTASFESMNVFVDTLKNAEVTFKQEGQGDDIKNKMFDQVLIQTNGLAKVSTNTVVSFTIKTVYHPTVFDVRSTGIKATVPSIVTTSSVTQSPKSPQQIFDDKKTEAQ